MVNQAPTKCVSHCRPRNEPLAPTDETGHYFICLFESGELSYRSGLVCGGYKLCPEWRALFIKYPGLFMSSKGRALHLTLNP